MKIRALIAVIVLLLVHPSAFSQFMDGNKLMQLALADERSDSANATNKDYMDSAKYIGYVKGAFDARMSEFPCVPNSFIAGQLVAVFTKYLKENPALWNLPGDFLVSRAVQKAFPCKK